MNKKPEVLESEMWDIDRLYPNDWNPNAMDDKTYELAKLSILEEGFSDPIDVDPSGRILDGEHRWRLAKELGMKQVPVFVKDRFDDDAKITTIRKDRTHGEPDLVRLSEIVGDLVDAFGQDEVERRLGYDPNEQQAFLEVSRWDWGSYGTEDEDAHQESIAETVTWSVGIDPDTRERIEAILPAYSEQAAKSDYGDTEQGRFMAFIEDARRKAQMPEYVAREKMATEEADDE